VAHVDLLHLGIGPDRLYRALGDHPLLAHHRHAVVEAEDAVDVVLEEQNRHVLGQPPHEPGDAFALGGGQAGEGLVEQQHPRPRRQRHAQEASVVDLRSQGYASGSIVLA
jgi:hypothetical protein